MSAPGHREHRSIAPWTKAEDPQRILVVRFHAIGDVALTLPACAALRRRYPDARIDLLTSPDAAPLANAVHLFDTVVLLRRPPGRIVESSELLATGKQLRQQRFQVVLDLQRNWKSRWIRRMIRPESWGEFDRFSQLPACDRTLSVFHDTGFHALVPVFEQRFTQSATQNAEALLRSHGWHPGDHLVLFNPAGLWETRNWPLSNYAELSRTWPGANTIRFLLVGTERLSVASQVLAGQLGSKLIDLTNRTPLDVAFALLAFVDVAITEDSGLMHMAWCVGTPLVALFGSSRHFWSLPTGDHVHAFHSGDLPCGACMRAQCKYGDNRCLTRVTPDAVLRAADALMRTHRREQSQQ